MPSLADLSAQWDRLEQELERSGGVADPEVEAVLSELLSLEGDKAEQYGWKIKQLRVDSQSAGDVARELLRKSGTLQSRADWLLQRMADYLDARGLERLRAGVWNFAFQKNGGPAPLSITVPIEEIPPRYHRVEITPDKEALRVALEGGAVIPGVTLGERGKSLRLKL